MSTPAVSIIVAAYRAGTTLDAALQSVAAQSRDDWECLVIDDGSDDDTLEVARAWMTRDPRFRVLATGVNAGPSAARNLGLAAARGEWITVLDADDLYEPERLAVLLRGAAQLDVEILFDNQWLLDAAGRSRRWLNFDAAALRRHGLDRFLYQVSGFSRCHWGIAQPLFRRRLLEQSTLRYDPALRFGEDVLLMAQLIRRAGAVGVCGYCGYVYRLPAESGGNLSLAKAVDPNLSTRKMIEQLGESVGWRGRMLLRLRRLHFELAGWRSAVADALRNRRFVAATALVATHPRSWLWLALNACRRLLP